VDFELTGALVCPVGACPTYGYWNIDTILRSLRNSEPVYRLTNKHCILLERHTRRRRVREDDGQIATFRPNSWWHMLAPTSRNGQVVRVALTVDRHDRQALSWTQI